jgi:hypothetical protein
MLVDGSPRGRPDDLTGVVPRVGGSDVRHLEGVVLVEADVGRAALSWWPAAVDYHQVPLPPSHRALTSTISQNHFTLAHTWTDDSHTRVTQEIWLTKTTSWKSKDSSKLTLQNKLTWYTQENSQIIVAFWYRSARFTKEPISHPEIPVQSPPPHP